MTNTEIAELGGSVLTFLGGVLLVVDAFSPVRGLYLQGGREKWEWLLSQLGSKKQKSAAAEPPPNDTGALAHAKGSQRLTRWGFILVTAGFLADLLAKLHFF